ncbi:hypothetical protein BDZ45DRAFT_754383 [Acephala macrosclerotiorum]|nr:hypothetical protein BDZ45DRAFT_754383 [Acephala macrosclerotiorum]
MSGRRNGGRRPSRSNSHRRPSNGGIHPGVPAHHLAALEALDARMNNDNPEPAQPERHPRRQSRGANPNAGEAATAAAAAAVARNQAAAPIARNRSQRSHRSHRSHRSQQSNREERAQHLAEHLDLELDLPNAVPKAYDVRDLARLLRANAATAPVKFATRLDITQQGIVRGNAPNNLSSNTTAEIREFLEAWVGILDTVFFFGSLIRKGLEGGFSLYHKPGSRRQGFYDPGRKNIRINTAEPPEGDSQRDPAGFAEALICTLLNTMLTAFFDIYGCECDECTRNNAPQKGGMGAGHGPPFINALAPMSEALGQEVPWHVDCRVRESLELEMQQSKWKPTAQQFAMFGEPDVARPDRPARQANLPVRLPVDNNDDHEHHRRTGVQRRHPKDEDKCCVIL